MYLLIFVSSEELKTHYYLIFYYFSKCVVLYRHKDVANKIYSVLEYRLFLPFHNSVNTLAPSVPGPSMYI